MKLTSSTNCFLCLSNSALEPEPNSAIISQAASLLVALLLLSWAAVPGSIKSSARTTVIKTFFRPEHKLLSEEEFITQGVVETKKALDQLKEFCRSPESKPWQTVRKLQSPVRLMLSFFVLLASQGQF